MRKEIMSLEIEKDMVMKFLDNFGISRPGFYDVPRNVLEAGLECFMQDGTIEPLLQYERTLYFLWNAQGTGDHFYTQDELNFIATFLRNEGYWMAEEVFDEEDLDTISDHLKRKQSELTDYHSYPARRKRSDYAIRCPRLRERIISRDGGKCRACGSKTKLSLDHVIPVRKGGTDEEDNLQTLCVGCNSSKGGR